MRTLDSLRAKLDTIDRQIRGMEDTLARTHTDSFTTDPFPGLEDALYSLRQAAEAVRREIDAAS